MGAAQRSHLYNAFTCMAKRPRHRPSVAEPPATGARRKRFVQGSLENTYKGFELTADEIERIIGPRTSHIKPVPVGPNYVYRAYAVRVIDGDTYVLDLDLGFHVFTKQHIRLHGVSCPELREPGGQDARIAVDALLMGRAMMLQTYMDRQTFARWLADCWVYTNQWISVGDWIVDNGYGWRA